MYRRAMLMAVLAGGMVVTQGHAATQPVSAAAPAEELVFIGNWGHMPPGSDKTAQDKATPIGIYVARLEVKTGRLTPICRRKDRQAQRDPARSDPGR